jgi:hypothetical protein
MITNSDRRGADKADLMRLVAEISPVTEAGCLRVDFHNRATNAPDVAFLRLDQCPRTHGFGAQLDKLRPLIGEPRWPEVLRHLSALITMGVGVYSDVVSRNQPLIRRIYGLDAEADCRKYATLTLDRANTTLYIDAEWPNRIGLFVTLQSELTAEERKNSR